MQKCHISGRGIPVTVENGIAVNPVSYLGIELQCPCCRNVVEYLHCSQCGFRMEMGNGIVHALPPHRAVYYARFIEDYERIRAAEGRGSKSEEFYLALPYKDISGRNSDQWRIRSKSFDYLVEQVLKPLSHSCVLDLGAGNCWMSFRLSLSGYKPIAVDLLTNANDGLGAATHFQRRLPIPIPRFQAELTRLPFQDGQFGAIIFNASFHYSESYELTLREALRCLKPEGMVIIIDTPWYSCEASGRQMVTERHAAFQRKFGTASDSVKSLEYLTDRRLKALEETLSITWTIHHPWYGAKWAMRPWIAKLRSWREPSRFHIYVARKHV